MNKKENFFIQNIVDALEPNFPMELTSQKNRLREAMSLFFSQEDNLSHVFKMIKIINKASTYLKEELGLTEGNIKDMKKAAFFHDLGKVSHPEIYKKPGPLTDEETNLKKLHPVDGFELIKDSNLNNDVKMLVLKHQIDYGDRRGNGNNHFNSSDKRSNSEGRNFPLMLDIFFMIDQIEAMTSSDRPYREKPLSKEFIFQELSGKLPHRKAQVSKMMKFS